MASSASLYMASGREATRSTAYQRIVAAVLAVLVGLTTVIAVFTTMHKPKSVMSASAAVLCGGTNSMGYYMDPQDWNGTSSNIPLADSSPRDLTLQQAVGHNMNFVFYTGEGGKDKGSWPLQVIDVGTDRGKSFSQFSANESKLENVRSTANCTFGVGADFFANGLMYFSTGLTWIMQQAADLAFDSKLICANSTSTDCVVDLAGIVGGKDSSSSGGIIGALTSSVYLPMIGFAVIMTGCWIGYIGLVKRQVRQAFFGLLWLAVSFILGLAALLNPSLLARGPMIASNSITACVVGSFNGQNCLNNSTSNSSLKTSTTESDVCYENVPNASVDEKAAIAVDSLSCSIWKAFVLEPYAQGNFGQSYEDLESSGTIVSTAAKKAGIDPNVFCVNMGTNEAVSSQNPQLSLDRSVRKVCNLAAYQMFLSTNAVSGNSAPSASGKLDTRWYNIVLTTANDAGLWKYWAPSTGANAHRFSMGFTALVSATLGCIVLGAIAIYAIVYLLICVVMLAFAPIFFLIGVYPPGRRILLGFGEAIISNLLKYLISLVFLLVAVAFYAALLGSIHNSALILIMVIILSAALFMYRHEIINLLGRANMGGQQLSNTFSQRVLDYRKRTQNIGIAMAGSAIGARTASGLSYRQDRSLKGFTRTAYGNVKTTLAGARTGARREIQSNPISPLGTIVSGAIQEQDRIYDKNRGKLDAEARQQQEALGQARQSVFANQAAIEDLDTKYNKKLTNQAKLEKDFNSAREREEQIRGLEGKAVESVSINNPLFGELQSTINAIRSMKLQVEILRAHGQNEQADMLESQLNAKIAHRDALQGKISKDDFDAGTSAYNAELADMVASSDPEVIKAYKERGVPDGKGGWTQGKWEKTALAYAASDNELIELKTEMNKAIEQLNNNRALEAETRTTFEALDARRDNLSADGKFTTARLDKWKREANDGGKAARNFAERTEYRDIEAHDNLVDIKAHSESPVQNNLNKIETPQLSQADHLRTVAMGRDTVRQSEDTNSDFAPQVRPSGTNNPTVNRGSSVNDNTSLTSSIRNTQTEKMTGSNTPQSPSVTPSAQPTPAVQPWTGGNNSGGQRPSVTPPNKPVDVTPKPSVTPPNKPVDVTPKPSVTPPNKPVDVTPKPKDVTPRKMTLPSLDEPDNTPTQSLPPMQPTRRESPPVDRGPNLTQKLPPLDDDSNGGNRNFDHAPNSNPSPLQDVNSGNVSAPISKTESLKPIPKIENNQAPASTYVEPPKPVQNVEPPKPAPRRNDAPTQQRVENNPAPKVEPPKPTKKEAPKQTESPKVTPVRNDPPTQSTPRQESSQPTAPRIESSSQTSQPKKAESKPDSTPREQKSPIQNPPRIGTPADMNSGKNNVPNLNNSANSINVPNSDIIDRIRESRLNRPNKNLGRNLNDNRGEKE